MMDDKPIAISILVDRTVSTADEHARAFALARHAVNVSTDVRGGIAVYHDRAHRD
jgi:hypothetical protein